MIAQALSPASDDLVCSLALLDLSDNALFHDADPGQSGRFGAAVAGCGALTTLRLAATGIGTMAPHSRGEFFSAVGTTSSVISLDLGHNELGRAGGKELATVLTGGLGAQLVCLELCGNALCAPASDALEDEEESVFATTNEDGAAIAQLVRAIEDGAPRLRVLGLAKNGIGPQTCIALLRGLGRSAGEDRQCPSSSSESESEGAGESDNERGDGAATNQQHVGECGSALPSGKEEDGVPVEASGDADEAKEVHVAEHGIRVHPVVVGDEPGVTALDLSHNAIGDTGARLISQWLESADRACSLRRLCLSRNRIRENAKRALGQVLLRAAAAEVAAESSDAGGMTQLLATGASQTVLLRTARRQQRRRRARQRFSACRLGSLAMNQWDVRPLAHLAVLAAANNGKLSDAIAANSASHGASVELAELALKPGDATLLAGIIACSAHCARQQQLAHNSLRSSVAVSAVTELNLSGSVIGLEGVRALLAAARAHKLLRRVDLSNNLLGPGTWNRNRTAALSAALELIDLRDPNGRSARGGGNCEEQTGVSWLNLGMNWLGAPVKKHFGRSCAARTAQAVFINGVPVESGSGCSCYQFVEPEDGGPLCAKCGHIRSLHKKPRMVKLYVGANALLQHAQHSLGDEGSMRKRVLQLHDNGWENCDTGTKEKLRELLVQWEQCGLSIEGISLPN